MINSFIIICVEKAGILLYLMVNLINNYLFFKFKSKIMFIIFFIHFLHLKHFLNTRSMYVLFKSWFVPEVRMQSEPTLTLEM